MSSVRAIHKPQSVFSSITCCSYTSIDGSSSRSTIRVRIKNTTRPRLNSPLLLRTIEPWIGLNHQSRMVARACNWTDAKSPYETLEVERDADEERIKLAYRRLAKLYHPDVYDGSGNLEEGETAMARFIRIQAAYELLIDKERRRQYDYDNQVNPMKASQAWMEWVMKKRKAFEQRGDMAVAAWAEQRQREMNIRARRLSRSKVDPEEEKRILTKEKKASVEYFNSTMRRHTLVLRKRDIMRKKAEEEKRNVLSRLLAAEGLELETDDDE